MYYGIDRSRFRSPLVYVIKDRNDCPLVGNGNVDAQYLGAPQTSDKVLHSWWGDFPSLIGAINAIVVQRGLLEFWRYGVPDGSPDNSQNAAHDLPMALLNLPTAEYTN
jgi:hypothetical protein